MYQHPFARAVSPATCVYNRNPEKSKRRMLEAHPASSKLANSSTKPETVPQKVQSESVHRRPPHSMAIQDAGVTLTLNGQEENATLPEYGRGATVDGTVSFANPGNITKVEVKIEGHMTVQELDGFGSGAAEIPLLSELLVFWDAPNRLGGYSNGATSGDFAPLPGSCPRTISFRSTLPTQYIEADGSECALPPSFANVLPGVPGFRCAVRYAIRVCITRVRDVRMKTLRAQWKRKTVFRTPVEYRPRTRPSQPAPFPASSKDTNVGPVTRFSAAMESLSPFMEPIRTTFYLPNSQITSLSTSIPFFLRVSGPESTINAYSRPPLSSFLPKAGPESFPTICSMIGHVVNENMQNSKLARMLSLPGGRSDSWSALDGEKESEGWGSEEKGRRTRGANPSTGVRVSLVRDTSVHAYPYSNSRREAVPDDEFDVRSDTFVETESSSSDDGSGSGRNGSYMHKRTVLGEGVMYTASVSRGSITWAGEIRIDPSLGVRTGGFCTRNLVVRDMLIVSVREPHADASSGKHRIFEQVIPMHLTTNTFKDDQ